MYSVGDCKAFPILCILADSLEKLQFGAEGSAVKLRIKASTSKIRIDLSLIKSLPDALQMYFSNFVTGLNKAVLYFILYYHCRPVCLQADPANLDNT